jgi:methylamine dehydrogenase heavy chain
MRAVLAICALVAAPALAVEPLQSERPSTESLPPPSPHWVLVNDANFLGYLDGKVYLFDGDSGKMLGMMSTGGYQNAVEIAPSFAAIYSPNTFYARGAHGARTDAIVIFETKGLTSGDDDEIVIPPKRATGMPERAYNAISDDGRFVYVANMTPATSITVADVVSRKFLSEIDTPGCSLVYPTGRRSIASLCGDGTLETLVFDDAGRVASRAHTAAFFDPNADPLTEKASRYKNAWLFVSFEGYVHPVEFDAGVGTPKEKWSLFSDAERAQGHRVGGGQFTAVHEGKGLLYVIVNEHGPYSHKTPGEHIWVYDLATHKRKSVIEVGAPVTAIAVTKDAAPLLFATVFDTPGFRVLDALTGETKRVITSGPFTPGFPQVP